MHKNCIFNLSNEQHPMHIKKKGTKYIFFKMAAHQKTSRISAQFLVGDSQNALISRKLIEKFSTHTTATLVHPQKMRARTQQQHLGVLVKKLKKKRFCIFCAGLQQQQDKEK
ncbi:hypothetical protein ACKWTF_015560 [Chironomus riparius]